MKTNITDETNRKSAKEATDADIVNALRELTNGHLGHWATYDIPTDEFAGYFTVFHSRGWTDAGGKVHEQPPDFLHSVDALLPILRLLSFEGQCAVCRRVRIDTPPREIGLEILREMGVFQ